VPAPSSSHRASASPCLSWIERSLFACSSGRSEPTKRRATQDQDTGLQIDALKRAGCGRIFAEKASGAQRERPQLSAALDYMRPGDTLVVWKLDRLVEK